MTARLDKKEKMKMVFEVFAVVVITVMSIHLVAADLPSGWEQRIVVNDPTPDYELEIPPQAIAIAPNGVHGILYLDNRYQPPRPCGWALCPKDFFLQIFEPDGEPRREPVRITSHLEADARRSSLITDRAGNFYVVYITGSGVPTYRLNIAKVDQQGNIFSQRTTAVNWTWVPISVSAAFGQDNVIYVVYKTNDHREMRNRGYYDPTGRNLIYNQIDVNTGNLLKSVLVEAPAPTREIWGYEAKDPFIATDPQGNAFISYLTLSVRYLLKIDPSGSVVYNKRIPPTSDPYATSYADWYFGSIAYADGKVHLVWPRLNYRNPPTDIMYSQVNPDTGELVYPSVAVASTSDSIDGMSLAVDGDKVDIVYAQLDMGMNEENFYHAMLRASDGSILTPSTRFTDAGATIYLWAVSSAFGYGRIHALAVDGGDPIRGGNKLYDYVYLPKIGGQNPQRGVPNILTIDASRNANDRFAMRAAFALSPGIPIAPYGELPLTPDPLFFLSPNLFINGGIGSLDRRGVGSMELTVPRDVPSGTAFYVAAVLFTTNPTFRITGTTSAKYLIVQ